MACHPLLPWTTFCQNSPPWPICLWWLTIVWLIVSLSWVRQGCGPLSSVQFSHSVVYNSLWPHEPQHARPPCLSPTPRVYTNSCPLSQWCHPTISSSVVRFSSCTQSFPPSGSFEMSQLFTSGGQNIGVSASTPVLPMNTQYARKFGRLSSGHRPGKGQFSFQSQRKAIPKNALTTAQLNSSHSLVKQSPRLSKPGYNNTWTVSFQMFNLDLEKAEEPEIKLPTSIGS